MMRLEDYNYNLPESQIAQKAHHPRDQCKFLIVNRKEEYKKEKSEKKFYQIIDYLSRGDVLVLNNTKVMNAKIYGKKTTGSTAEIILTKKISNKGLYECHIKTKNPHPGTKIEFNEGTAVIISQKNIDTYVIKISGNPKKYLPGPPYIHKKMGREYQTIYAKKSGSLAAPTAGLHFTKRLLKKIKDKGVKILYVTLHVGYATFSNIIDINTHKMHEEYFEITRETANSINRRKGRLFVVGTTTLKALESSSTDGKITAYKGFSTLFIKPGHEFNSKADALITNFHLPKSTLLLLTCAFGGRQRVMSAYKYAVKNKYLFFSLGDAMILFRKNL